MRKTREVLRLYFELKLGQRQIARSANVSQSTVHDYVTRFTAAGLNWPLPAEMSEAALEGKIALNPIYVFARWRITQLELISRCSRVMSCLTCSR
jgi:hypothetical protein